jgi:predicted nuclease of predicted toxin-antitoxin system
MNLTPAWIEVLRQYGWECQHWSAVGDPRATDQTIMEWAYSNGYVILTHDLDFGAILAATQANGPSVVQVRARDVLPAHLESILVQTLQQFEALLEAGVLIVLDESRSRVIALPLHRV